MRSGEHEQCRVEPKYPHGHGFIEATSVKFAGNARASGFTNFDIITQIGDKPVESLKDVRDIYDAGLKLEKGKRKLLFGIIRQGYRRLVVLDFEKDMEKIEDE